MEASSLCGEEPSLPRGRINAENAAAVVEEDCVLHTVCAYTIHITQHTGETSTQLYSSTWYTLRAARCSQDSGAPHYCGQQVVRCTGAGQSKGGDGTLGGDNEEAGFNIIPPSSNQPTNPTTPAANALPSFSIPTFSLRSGQSKKLSSRANQSLCVTFFVKLPHFLDCSHC